MVGSCGGDTFGAFGLGSSLVETLADGSSRALLRFFACLRSYFAWARARILNQAACFSSGVSASRSKEILASKSRCDWNKTGNIYQDESMTTEQTPAEEMPQQLWIGPVG